MSVNYKTAYLSDEPPVEDGHFIRGAMLGVTRMRSLANDFEAMAGAMAGVPSHWAAQMAKALRRDADAFEEEVRNG